MIRNLLVARLAATVCAKAQAGNPEKLPNIVIILTDDQGYADVGEATDVSQQHLEIVKQLEAEVEKARADLGDALTKRLGPGRREPGSISRAGTPSGK